MATHENYHGVFLMHESQFAGLLSISGANSILKVVGNTPWKPPKTEHTDIHGILNDGRKASLLNCVAHRETAHHFGAHSSFESSIFPNYIVVGEEFIRYDEPVIRAVRYHFPNINCLISGHETFKHISLETNEIQNILKLDHERREKIAKEHDWPPRPYKPEISEYPQLLYFSGLWEIVACEVEIGKISLTNRTSGNMGSADGIGFNNEVTANIDFTKPKTLQEAIYALITLHSLLELSLGYRQRYQWIELELDHRSKATGHDTPQTARLYWSMCNERVKGNSELNLHGILLAPDLRTQEFTEVTKGWMNSVETMGDPRSRFATAFFGSYGINRIVGAANMFDLLPDSHAPKAKEADESLKDAVRQCREIFAGLPDSFARQSVFSALGRIGKASLRDKIHHRAGKVIAAAGPSLSEIYLPCNHAVLARNHYVHGSERTFDYQKHFTEFVFIIDTLEFIFAASDLLDLGWNLRSWMDNILSTRHPFGSYITNYSENISRLKTLVAK